MNWVMAKPQYYSAKEIQEFLNAFTNKWGLQSIELGAKRSAKIDNDIVSFHQMDEVEITWYIGAKYDEQFTTHVIRRNIGQFEQIVVEDSIDRMLKRATKVALYIHYNRYIISLPSST